MSKPGQHAVTPGTSVSAPATGTGTPARSASPPASESFFSEFDGTAASVLDTSFGDVGWEPPADASRLNIVSWKLDVDARVDDGVDRRGFNAISTVLNHPTKKANPLRASRKPLPAIAAPPLLPKPYPASHYDGYLKQIAPLYESFVQNQKATAAAAASSAAEIDLAAREAAKADLPNLDVIPPMFFDTGFDIANPSTWAEVMDGAASSSKADRDEAIQDSLSTHLDNLERHLVHEITLRSSSFFSALSNLQDLNSESSSCLSRIADLKSALSDVGGKQAKKGLEIIEAQSRLRDLRITEDGVKHVAELDEILRVARGLADGGDWAGALGCVEDVVRWWERNGESGGQEENQLPLTTLPALVSLPTSISVLTTNIAGQLEGVLSSMLLSLLAEADMGKEFDAQNLRDHVGTMLGGLVRCGKVDMLNEVWRNTVTTSIREGLRQHLPVSQDESEEVDTKATEARGQGLAQKLQAMEHREFLLLCKAMYGSMLARLQLAQKMGDELAAILASNSSVLPLSITPAGAPPPPLSRTPDPSPFDPADVLNSSCELANSRASKIIAVRSEQHAALPINEFVNMFGESWAFVVATEKLAKRMIVSLRGVTASQCRTFLVSYHGQRLTKSAKLVEEETWVQIDVPRTTQHAVDLIVEAAVSDPLECFIPPKGTANGAVNGDNRGPTKLVTIEDRTFFVVKATSESLALLSDYLSIIINLELVVTDVMSRIIEFLKSFNSRTCQVVLGAGAMRSAGLKNITAKHLALASQSLSVVVALIPYIREFIRRHLSVKQAVMLIEFDKLKRDYQEHQNEIHAKLVAIMADRLAVHCGELREINWETAPTKDGPHQYSLMLVKETATLHKVLSKYLAASTVDTVMGQVVAASVHRLSEEYGKVEFKSEDAKKRMLTDVALIVSRLSPLAGSSSSVSSLETLVREKTTPRRPVASTMRGLLRRKSTDPTSPNVPVSEVEPGDDDDDGATLTTDDKADAAPPPRRPSVQSIHSRPTSPTKVALPASPQRVATPPPKSPSPQSTTLPFRAASPVKAPSPLRATSPLPGSPVKVASPLPRSPSPLPSSPVKAPSPLPASPVKAPSPVPASPVKAPSPLPSSPQKQPSPIPTSPPKAASPAPNPASPAAASDAAPAVSPASPPAPSPSPPKSASPAPPSPPPKEEEEAPPIPDKST